MNWIFENKVIASIEDFKEDIFGFIYEITFNDGKKYIGSKVLYYNKKLAPLKGYKRKRKKVVESDWQTYVGSAKNEELKEALKSGEMYPTHKVILYMCQNKSQLSYHETRLLFLNDCLMKDNYYNTNILGKFFRKNIIEK